VRFVVRACVCLFEFGVRLCGFECMYVGLGGLWLVGGVRVGFVCVRCVDACDVWMRAVCGCVRCVDACGVWMRAVWCTRVVWMARKATLFHGV
jgi:hypothetical protein